jgi:hypothetical protein
VHPSDGLIRFEYTKDAPSEEEELHRCPERYRLECDDNDQAKCVLDEVVVDIGPDWPCVDLGREQTMYAQVLGSEETAVVWDVVEGPATIDAQGVLAGTAAGEVRVRGTSVADEEAWDEAVVRVGTCTCAFEAIVAGDSNRGRVRGEMAVFSTRGAVGSMASGGLDGAAAGDFLTDLADLAERLGGLTGGDSEAQAKFAERLRQKVGGTDPGDGEAPRGRTVTMSFIESGGGPLSPGTFQLDLMAEASIEPGFSGALPVSGLSISTGERTADGGAPWIFTWGEGKPGRASLHVESYDGDWLVGRLDATLSGAAGLLVADRRPTITVGLEFTAGAMNPMQFQGVCFTAEAMSDAGE